MADPMTLAAGAVLAKDAAVAGVRAARTISSVAGTRSISRLAKDAIFQFPVLISGDIEPDTASVIAKAYEREFASLVVAAMSLNSEVDRSKYENTGEFLKSIHNSTNVPAPVFHSGHPLMEGMESAIIDPSKKDHTYCDPVTLYSLWDSAEEQFDTETINDMYKPFTRTARQMTNRMEMALEAQARPDSRVEKNAGPFDEEMKGVYASAYGNKAQQSERQKKAQNLKNKYSRMSNAPTIQAGGRSNSVIKPMANEVSMEPTLVEISLTNYSGSAVWANTITIGVKAMVRVIPSGQMIANMIEAAQDRAIFKAIKWNRGEIKLLDVLFGGAKKAGQTAAGKNTDKWIRALRNRAKTDLVSRIGGMRLTPTTTIVMTQNEVAAVREQTGVDISDASAAKKIMSRYFILGIGIYNPDTNILSAIFDGDDNYTDTSFRQLLGTIKKTTDILNTSSVRHFV